MNSQLGGKVVVVTGASGGIGSAVARSFAAERAQLVLHYRRNASGIKALQRDLHGVETLAVQADLAKESDAARLFAATLKRFGQVDTLVANAGSWETADVPLERMTLRQWRETMEGVLTTMFLSLRAFMKCVAKQKRGNAVLVASTAAVFGEAGHADYAAAKAAIAFGLTRSLKNEFARLAPHTSVYCGGRVNCLCPGWTVVPRNARKLGDKNVIRRVMATMALPQLGRPEDVANASVFLASDHLARHITGQTIILAGGMEGRWLWRPEEVDPTIV